MKEELSKEIEVEKEILSTLPKNNKKNIEKYKDNVLKELEKYKEKEKDIEKEIKRRKELIEKKLPEDKFVSKEKDLEQLEEDYFWFSNYNTSYEKMGMDKLLSSLDTNTLTYESINKIILELINLYKEAKISLTLNDFSYSPLVFQFMKVFYKNINNLNNKELASEFEKIYWKESNIIIHIELTFKSIYRKYESLLDKYCIKKRNSLIQKYNGSLVKTYKKEKQEEDINKINIKALYEKIMDKEYNPNDFTEEQIKKVMDSYINIDKLDENSYNETIEEFSKLKNTLNENLYILKYNYIIEDVNKLYKEKSNYKGISKKKLDEIKKEEKKLSKLRKGVYLLNKEKSINLGFLFKLTKKIWYLKSKKNKEEVIDKSYMEIDNQIMEIKKLYDDFEISKFNEQILKLNDNSELISIFKLANSYYIYQDNLLKEQELNTEDTIKEVNKFILSPYNNLINNINIENNKNIKKVIMEKYKLSGINLTEESLDDPSTIEGIIKDINKILYYDVINKSGLKVEDIIYVYTVNSLIEK